VKALTGSIEPSERRTGEWASSDVPDGRDAHLLNGSHHLVVFVVEVKTFLFCDLREANDAMAVLAAEVIH
jgi:hypothetical protein